MKSALILVSSFLVVAAVHGSVLLETRDNDKSKDLHHSQGGNGTFLIQSNCSAPCKPYFCVFQMHVLSVAVPTAQGTGQTGYGIPVTPVTNQTNQTSDGAPPSQVPFPKCFNLTDLSGNQTSVIVQFNKTSLAQGDQPLVNQTASPGGNTNGSSSDPQCVTFLCSLFPLSSRLLNNVGLQVSLLPEYEWHGVTIRERD